MKKAHRIRLNAMSRGHRHVLDHPVTPAIPALTAATTGLGGVITQLETLGGGRIVGTGTVRGAVETRQAAKAELRDAVSAVSKVAKTLDKATHPNVAAQLEMRRHATSYAGLAHFARAVITVITPIEQVFVDHGAAATLVDDLEAKLAAMIAAGNLKSSGLGNQIGKGEALDAIVKTGMDYLRKLDSILSQVYKGNVELLAAWKAAKRLERDLPEEEPTTPTPTPAPGNGSGASVN